MNMETGFALSTLKSNLKETDWVIVKIAEAETPEEQQTLREKYAGIIVQRKEWRAQINQLEEELSSLNNNK